MLQLSGQYLLLGANLGLGMQMLQAATAAGAEMDARGRYPIRTRRKYLDQLAAVEVSSPAEVTQPDGFTRQRVFDERDLTVDVRDAAAVVVKRLDMCLGDIADWIEARVFFSVTRARRGAVSSRAPATRPGRRLNAVYWRT